MRPRHLALAILLAVGGSAQAARDGDVLVYVTISYRDLAQLQSIASRFQHLIVDERAKTAQTEASREDIDALRRAGIRVEIDEAKTSRMRETELAMQQGVGIESISGFPCYRTVEETYATMDALASAHPNLARVVDIGPSWLRSGNPNAGYRMRVLRLTNAATDVAIPTKADMVVLGSIHAREYTPAEVLTRFGEWLVAGYGVEQRSDLATGQFPLPPDPAVQSGWPQTRRIRVVLAQERQHEQRNLQRQLLRRRPQPQLPLFLERTAGRLQRKSLRQHVPRPGGSPRNRKHRTCFVTSPAHRTPTASTAAACFPIVAATRRRAQHRPTTAACSSTCTVRRGLVLWPWAFQSTAPPNRTALRTLGRRMAWFNDYSPRQWTGLYIADGTTTDTVYGLLGAPSYTIEMGAGILREPVPPSRAPRSRTTWPRCVTPRATCNRRMYSRVVRTRRR